MPERIPLEGWQDVTDHVARYRWAGSLVRPGQKVNDIACGVGYGATFLTHAIYRGYDKPGVPEAGVFPGEFLAADLDDPDWVPPVCDVTVCFETIEHVTDPAHLAKVICATTRRSVFLSVPLYPHTENPFHLTTFTVADIPPLFEGFRVAYDRPQPEARAHLWLFEREAVGT